MEKHVITISEEIISNVVKPMSMFLNDIAAGAVFTHIPLVKGTEYKKEKKDGKDIFPVFKFSSSKGGTYKFTAYDLRNFEFDKVDFNDYFIPRPGKPCMLQQSFTITTCEPVEINGEKVYPLFCYEGYDTYVDEKQKLTEGSYPTEAMFTKLKESGVKTQAVNKYYRKINIDKPIFYYAD